MNAPANELAPACRLSPHIALQVADHDAALEFFKTFLRASIVERGEHESAVKCGDVTFHVEQAAAGKTFFELETDDLDATHAALERAGCNTTASRTPEGDPSWLVATPFGFRFHLYAPR